jgi:hypothetical protein
MMSYVPACLLRRGLRVSGFIEITIFRNVNKLTEQPAIYLMVNELINEIMNCGMEFSFLCHRRVADPLETLKEGDSILN